MKEKFREYLVQNHYREYTGNGVPSTIDKYVNSVNKVCCREGLTWEEAAYCIDDLVSDYDKGGKNEEFGNNSNRTVINALKKYRDYIDVTFGIKKINGYQDHYNGNYPIYYDSKVPESKKIPGLRSFIKEIILHLMDICGRYVLFDESISDLRQIKMGMGIPIILSNDTPVTKYKESDEYIARKIIELFVETSSEESDTLNEDIMEILRKREYSVPTLGMYFSRGAEKYVDHSVSLPNGDRPYITIYYKNFGIIDEDEYQSRIAMTCAHEYFHFLHNILAMDTFYNTGKFSTSVKEALADFSSVMFILWSKKHFSTEAANLHVARDRYDAWVSKFGSAWPYANALYFYMVNNRQYPYDTEYNAYLLAGSLTKFNAVLKESRVGMKTAYELLTDTSGSARFFACKNIGDFDETNKLLITNYPISKEQTPAEELEEERLEERLYDNVVEHSNSDKYLLPLYIYDYLKDHSSPSKHISQQNLMYAMEKIYDVKCDRKTIAKAVKTLALSNYGIVYDAINPRNGCWYDKNEEIGYFDR